MSADFLISMTLTAINDITPVIAEINAQLDTLKANLGTLGTATAAADTKAIEGMAPAMAAAAQESKNLTTGLNGAGNAAQKTASNVKTLKGGFSAISKVGLGMTAVGAVLGYGVVHGLNLAGELQSKLVTIQDTTGATTKEMNSLSDSIMNVSSNVSRFSDLQVAGFAQQLASGGLGSVKNVQSLLMPITQFADAQMYEGKVSDGSEAVNMGINMAHLMGHYDPKSLAQSLDTFNKYSAMEPGSSNDLFQTLKYLAPTALRSMHMNESSVMQMATLANRVGLTGSHGGTNAADMVLRLIPGYVMGMGGKPSKTVMSAMQQLGMVDSKGQSQFFKNGQIVDFPKLVQTLVNDGKKFNPEQLTTLYGHVFGIQGGRAATIFADPKVLQQLQGMATQLQHTKSMEQIQRDQQNTPQGQLNQLKSNMQTANVRMAMQLGNALNPLLHTVNAILVDFLKFEQFHPRLLKFVGVFGAIAGGVLLTIGPTLMLIGAVGKLGLFFAGPEFKMGLKIIKQISGATKIWAAIQWVLNGAMDANPIAIVILAIAALIPLVILVITHWKTCVHWLQEAWNWFKHLGVGAQTAIAMIMPIVGIPALIVAHWKQIASFFDNIWKHISPVIGDVEKFLGLKGGGPSTPIVGAGGSGQPVQVTNHWYISSTDPQQAATEVSQKNDKYYQQIVEKDHRGWSFSSTVYLSRSVNRLIFWS